MGLLRLYNPRFIHNVEVMEKISTSICIIFSFVRQVTKQVLGTPIDQLLCHSVTSGILPEA